MIFLPSSLESFPKTFCQVELGSPLTSLMIPQTQMHIRKDKSSLAEDSKSTCDKTRLSHGYYF